MILNVEDYLISPKILQAAEEVERFQGLWQHTNAKHPSRSVQDLKQNNYHYVFWLLNSNRGSINQ